MADPVIGTSVMSALFTNMTNTVTGSDMLTWLLLFFIFAAAMIGIGLPIELIIMFLFPLVMLGAMASGVGVVTTILYAIIFYIAVYFVNRFFLNG